MLLNLLLLAAAQGAMYNISAGSFWNSRLTSLMPGDILTLLPQTPGTPYTYTVGFRNAFVLNGSPNNPIIVQGAPGEQITMAMDADQNVVEISGSYFVFQNLRLTATTNAPGAIGLRLTNNASHCIIRGVTVSNVPDNGFTANMPNNKYVNVTFDRCEAYNTGGTGECFYVGCQGSGSTVSCQFINGALTNNYCHDTCVPSTCTGGSMGSGYQVKGWGSYGNLVKNNVCVRVSSVCILLYDDFDLGANIVDGNWIYGSVTDAGIQVVAGAVIRNNVIVNNQQGIVITNNQVDLYPGKANRNLVIVGNTIVNNQGTGIKLQTISPIAGTRFVNNVVIEDSGNAFSGPSQTGVSWQNNAYHGGSIPTGVAASGAKSVGTSTAEFQDVAAYNFHPKSSGSLLAAGAALTANDLNYDYSCVTRGTTPTIGAYETATGNALTLGFQAPCGVAGAPTAAPGSPTAANTPNSAHGFTSQQLTLVAGLSVFMFF